ncbi:RagB/SusD family nutrient uptake outer membrane protein [Bacteroides thetaiotaomicron]|nr:RagB/SusD family nutrient uptake outer membrane protein [Bacteroides thetaiotaomicron]
MWGQYYKGIRKCNTIFTRIDECKDLKGLDRREIMGLTHFMRASFYFYLLELYGPAVILPEEPLSVDENIENLSFERNTYDECVEYICKDLEEAYSLLDSDPSEHSVRTSYQICGSRTHVTCSALPGFQVVQRQSILCRLDHFRRTKHDSSAI